MATTNKGTARYGKHRQEFEKNKKRLLMKDNICGICGQTIDKRFKYPHPLSATVDHINPISRGGHLSDIDNLQLAHWICNRQKSNKITIAQMTSQKAMETIGTNNLPLSMDWSRYRSR